MSEKFSGTVGITNDSSKVTISLNGNSGNMTLGLPKGIAVHPNYKFETIELDGSSGNITLGGGGQNGGYTIHLDGQSGSMTLGFPHGGIGAVGQEFDTIRLDGSSGNITLGGGGQNGGYTIHLDGQSGSMTLGFPHGGIGAVGQEFDTIRLDGASGNITLGKVGQEGEVVVLNEEGKDTIHLDGQSGSMTLGFPHGTGPSEKSERIRLDGASGNITLGEVGRKGGLVVRNEKGKDTIHLDGDSGVVLPNVVVRNKDGRKTISLDGDAGLLALRNAGSKETVRINGRNGNISLDGTIVGGYVVARNEVVVRNKDGKDTIHLDGDAGDIILQNADCAEDFDVSESGQIEPGTVMVLNQEGELLQCTEAYDKKVAGVVSGAGECKPGIILDKQPDQANRRPVSLVGKVYCKVDAHYSSIEVGDLLTTSPTPGHAMRVDDPFKAFGAVLGKALRPLRSGTGLIPILVALQ